MHFLDPTDPSMFNFRVSVSEPQTWVLSVWYVCQSYVGPYVAAGHLYCAPLLPPHVPIVLPHSVSFIEHVRLGDHTWAMPIEGGERMAIETLEERAAALCCLHFAIPHLWSPPKVLHSPKPLKCGWYWVICTLASSLMSMVLWVANSITITNIKLVFSADTSKKLKMWALHSLNYGHTHKGDRIAGLNGVCCRRVPLYSSCSRLDYGTHS